MKRVFSVVFMIAILSTMAVVAAIDALPDAEARKKSQGTLNPKYGSDTKRIVCGDMLCSEIAHGKSAQSHMKDKSDSAHGAKDMSTPVRTQVGPVSIDSIYGASIQNTDVNRHSGTVTVSLNAVDDGKVKVNVPSMIKDVFMVLVDGEEWDDAFVEGNQVKVYFHAGAEKIEIIGNVIG